MNYSNSRIMAAALMIALVGGAVSAPGQSAFTYQGQLKENGAPADGLYDFVFRLYGVASGGAPVSASVLHFDHPVSNGLFTVSLDFGSNPIDGSPLWLQVDVRPGASTGAVTPLSPRQPLSAVPYALYALDGASWTSDSSHIYNANAGNVGIGTVDPSAPLHVRGDGAGNVVRISNGGSCGAMTNTGLSISDVCGSGRAASFYGVTSNDVLKVQNDGTGKAAEFVGDVAVLAGSVGVGTETPAAPVHVIGGTDTAPGGGGYIVNGSTTGANLSLDNNEIMARNNGSASTLFLNANGGGVSMGQYAIHPALAYGRISGGTASIISASSNVTGVIREAAGEYRVQIAGGLTGFDVPIAHGTNYFWRVSSWVEGGDLRVIIEDDNDGNFVFVIYRP